MLSPGDVVDRYVVVELLGRGGMGEVYAARDQRLERDVALKVLRADPDGPGSLGSLGSTAGAARMLREARAVALLEHPNVVAVYDVGEIQEPEALRGTTYLAMELIKGRSLRHYVGDPTIAVATRLRWLAEMARALAAAHARGLVHRDIKPENVMIREDGVVKVLDFGIARRAHAPLDPAYSTEGLIIPTVTTQGIVVGTPHYMAPEQMRGEGLDGRADQFSWAVVAYELLSGSTPWDPGVDALQLVAQVLSKPAESLAARVPALPPGVVSVVMRALSKARDDRFPSMADVIAHLESATSPESAAAPVQPQGPSPEVIARSEALTVAPGPTARPSRRWIGLAVGLGAAVAVAYGLRSRSTGGVVPGPERTSATRECTSSRACIQSHGGAAFRCRPDDGTCVPLASADCRVLATPADLEDDDTVWLGTMYPLTGPEASAFGRVESQAVDLARQDFALTMSGLTAQHTPGVRPIGLISCDDAADATRAARHLVDEVRVPAVIGFRSSAEVVDLATSLFLPRGVMTVAALNTSAQITRIPQPPGPRLVWRTTYNMSQSAAPLGLFVSGFLEPRLRADGMTGELRVALVRPKNTGALGFSSALFDRLTYNGKSALDNGANYHEFVWEDGDGLAASLAEVARGLGAFAPQVIVFQGDDRVVRLAFEPLEASWPPGRRVRPTYVTMTVLAPEVFRFVGKDAGRRRRFFGLTTVSTTPANARFVMHYNETFKDQVSRTVSPNSSYDAFYLLAYASYALGDQAPTGVNLAAAVRRLVPPGMPIEVGPTGIFDAFTALRRGDSIDLSGATGQLDFDLSTGDPPVDQAVLCVATGDDGRAFDSVESGVVYSAAQGKLEGALRCP